LRNGGACWAFECVGRFAKTGDGTLKALFILNDPPYGSERCYNALRLAHALIKNDPQAEVTVYLMADAVRPQRRAKRLRTAITTLNAC
jgi:hypothetical protein